MNHSRTSLAAIRAFIAAGNPAYTDICIIVSIISSLVQPALTAPRV